MKKSELRRENAELKAQIEQMRKDKEESRTRFQLVGRDGLPASDAITIGTVQRFTHLGLNPTIAFDLLEPLMLVATRPFDDIILSDPTTGKETARWNSLVMGYSRTISGIVGDTVHLAPGSRLPV